MLQGQPALQQEILSSVLAQFPIVGDQLGRPEGLQGSATAVIIGSVTALYGIIGLGQAAHNAINVCWAVPRNIRLNPIMSRLHRAWSGSSARGSRWCSSPWSPVWAATSKY